MTVRCRETEKLPWAGEPTEAGNYKAVIVRTEDGNCDMQMANVAQTNWCPGFIECQQI